MPGGVLTCSQWRRPPFRKSRGHLDLTPNRRTKGRHPRVASVQSSVRKVHRPPASRAGAKPTTTASTTKAPLPAETTARTVPASAPALHERLKPLLNKGVDMGLASQGFRNAEQFATAAHAARNTGVPFMVLKHRLLEEGKSLEDAIHEFKPDLSAPGEAARARAEATADISALEG